MRPIERAYWVFHVDAGDEQGTLEAIYAAYRTKEIKSLNVYLLYPDAEQNFSAWMEAYTSGQLVARSDERFVTYLSDTTNGQTLIQDGQVVNLPKNPKSAAGQLVADLKMGEQLHYNEDMVVALSTGSENKITFKAVGRLSVVIQELRRPDRWFQVITGSYWYDIPFIYTGIEKVKDIAMYSGRPANTIPMVLKRVPVETSFTDDSGKKRRKEMHCIQLEVRDDVIAGLMSAYEDTPFSFQLTARPQLPETVTIGNRPVENSYASESFDEPDEIVDDAWDAELSGLEGDPPVPQNGHEPDKRTEPPSELRPYQPEVLKAKIGDYAAYHLRSKTPINEKAGQILASSLNTIFGNSTDRYVFTAWIFGDGSTKSLKGSQIQALLDWLEVAHFGAMPDDTAVAEAKIALRHINKVHGQEELDI